MNHPIDRRQFLKQCTISSVGVLASPVLTDQMLTAQDNNPVEYTLAVVAGDRLFENTIRAIEALGGIRRFVRDGDTVALLINSYFDRPGAVVHTDIPLAVLKLCLDAGAKQIVSVEPTPKLFWKRGTMSEKLRKEIDGVGYSAAKKNINLPRGIAVKQGSVSAALMSCDVLINIPIIKDHQGTRYTGNLKNMMGGFSSTTCRRCHYGDQPLLSRLFEGAYEKEELLAQSIADLNLARSPDLSVADVTEILTTNGPAGPGKILKPMEIVAGTNALAVDMYAIKHLGLTMEETRTIQCAQAHRLGPKSLQEVTLIQS